MKNSQLKSFLVLHQLWSILQTNQRRGVVTLLTMMFIGACLEALSLGLIVPAFALITNADTKVSSFFSQFSFIRADQGQAVLFCLLLLVGVYLLKSGFLVFSAWRQNQFIFNLQADFSQRVYESYLARSYTFYLNHNSAGLIHNITNETRELTFSAFLPGTIIVTELLTLTGISILLFFVEPMGAFIVLCFGLIGALFLRQTRGIIQRWGEERQYNEEKRIQHLQQGFGGIKEVKLSGRENFFLGLYNKHNVALTNVSARYYTLQALPRIALDLMAVLGMALLCMVMILKQVPIQDVLAKIGLFVAAAFRSIPSINRVLGSMTNIPYTVPVIERIYADLTVLKNSGFVTKIQEVAFNHRLIFDEVSFRYDMSNDDVLKNISLKIKKYSTIGIVGASGAGKSTLLDLILGLLAPSKGMVAVDHTNIHMKLEALRGWQKQIGYVLQSIYITDDTLRRNIAFGLQDEHIDEKSVNKAIKLAQLDELVTTLPQGVDTFLGERGIRLSGGQRQRIGIARALYHNPSVLILDEATSSLDNKTEKDVMNAINAIHGEKTILIVAHRLSTVENCDVVYRLEKGRLVDVGSAKRVLVNMH